MFHPVQLVSFSLMHLEYFLEDLSDADARERLLKRDGTRMNAISWLVGHVAAQWLGTAARASETTDDRLQGLLDRRADLLARFEVPPSLDEARSFLHDVREACRWVETAGDSYLGSPGREGFRNRLHPNENAGTGLVRAVFHTWCQMGEINSIRQMLGHHEIEFVRFMGKNMEWLPEGATPDWVPYPPIHQVAPDPAGLGERSAFYAAATGRGMDGDGD
jgi:hypothetical protein